MASDVSGPSSRTRLGLILPSVNTVVEPWYASVVPDDVSVHFTRMLLPDRLTPEAVRQMDIDDGQRAMRQIRSCRPASVVYACFASSVVQGPEYDRGLAVEAAHITGCPSETAAGASVAALRVLDLGRLGIISPYAEEIDAAEHDYLKACGFEITASKSFGIRNSFDLATLKPSDMLLAASDMAGSVDGYFISCMNTPSHLAIGAIEEVSGLPVVTATSATIWAALRLAGRADAIPGLGRLGQVAWALENPNNLTP